MLQITSRAGHSLPPRSRPRHPARRALTGLALVLLALVVSGAAYQGIATAVDAHRYPPPGRLVDIGGYRLHVSCSGWGRPTVVLDALFPGTVSNWAWVQPQIARTTRVCAYDRAGLGWSDRGPLPRDARQHARELHTLLTRGQIPGPYVLVGHSLGGLSVREFAEEYPDEVAGMALVEASDPDAWARLGKPEGVGVDHRILTVAPALGALGVFRLGVVPSYAPDRDLPEHQRAELQAFFDSVKSLETIRDVDASFSAALDQVRHARGVGHKPLVVVLGTKGDGGVQALHDLFVRQAALSTDSVTRVVDGATHTGLVDNRTWAAATGAAVVEVVDAVRTGRPLSAHPAPIPKENQP